MDSLVTCQLNKVYHFHSFKGSKEYERHLRNLGLLPQVNISVISKEIGQPLIVVIGTMRIGLDYEIAKAIFVVPSTNKKKELQVMTQLGIGQKGKVSNIIGSGPLKRRLMDMGLTKGTEVEIKKYAPLGDPIEIVVRNYDLTLRKKEAEMILIESMDDYENK